MTIRRIAAHKAHSTQPHPIPEEIMHSFVYPNRFDTIIVGVGGMGSATAYHLARRGQRVLGLEQFNIPHDQGSSHGETRIIRLPYYEDSSYVMLLLRAYELWREIQRTSGQHLLHLCGSVDAGPADSWVFKGALQSAMEYELPHEVLTGKELKERFPGYNLPQDSLALFQPEGGFLTPERAILAYVFGAQALGAEIHGQEPVLRWEALGQGEGVRIHTTRAVYEADSLVITAGAWNDQQLRFLNGLAVPERQALAWFQPLKPALYQPESFPVFNLLVDEGRFYGFPVYGIPGFKIGLYHHFNETGPADAIDKGVYWEDEEALRACTAKYFPDAAGPTMTLKACMFTNAPDGHFIIDLHPQYPQVAYASACTGHGYKFASVIGEIMADLAQHRRSRHNIEPFTANRFHGRYDFGVGGELSNVTQYARREQAHPTRGRDNRRPGSMTSLERPRRGMRTVNRASAKQPSRVSHHDYAQFERGIHNRSDQPAGPSEQRAREQEWRARSFW